MKKLVMLTAYDYPTAKIIDSVGIDYILVGDSLAMSTLGYVDTKSVTMEEMLHHFRSVKRGVESTLLIADMPINSYVTPDLAIKNAKKFLEAGADMVKIEGNKPGIISALRKHAIHVVGHIGLLPQTAQKYAVQGKLPNEARNLIQDAVALASVGIQLLILECIPASLAKKITETISVPTIGIGAGPYTRGQVLVLADVIGLSDKKLKMAKQYGDVKRVITKAVGKFKEEVENGTFPAKENSFQ